MKIVFISGSPRGKESGSYQLAQYLTHFLDEKFRVEFIRLDAFRLSPDIREKNSEFDEIIERFQDADIVVWTFGIHVGDLPASLKLLIEYIFQHVPDLGIFTNICAAAICTSGRLFDDIVLSRIRLLSQAMGMHYLEDIAITGNQGLFYDDDEYTESQARRLARVLNKPSGILRDEPPLSACKREWLQPVKDFPEILRAVPETESADSRGDDHPLLILSSRSVKSDRTAAVCAEIITKSYRDGPVELICLEDLNLKRCDGCLWCNHYGDGTCKFKDGLDIVYKRIQSFSRMIVLTPGTGASDDYYHKVFIDRIWVDIHREGLKSTYGGIIMYGSGTLGESAVGFMVRVYRLLGVNIVHTIPELFDLTATNLSSRLKRMLEQVAEAHQAKDPIPVSSNLIADRRAITWITARWGYILVTDYDYLKKKGVFTWRERMRIIPGRILFSTPTRYRKLLRFGRNRITRNRIARLKLKLAEMTREYRPSGFGEYE